ncbi:RNA-binding protein FUS-like [Nymphalis io]|uniref:RNA-binding protein FUS-like n=1 Tax=Inachis io TaxID=171585 RepID=UPI002168D923|nr:RNA-binding protein FUS-like [Nymphalis io]
MMKKTLYFTFIVLLVVVTNIESKRSMSRSRSSGSGRSTSRKTNTHSQPAPTPLSHSQASAPKPSLFGWQEKPAQKSQGHSYPQSNTGLSGSNQPKTSQQEAIQRSNVPLQQSKPVQTSQSGHAYPQSNTGLSGNSPPKTSQQESMQRSNVPLQQSGISPQNSQSGASYPASNGLSGNSGSGTGYPQGSGLSGSNSASLPNQGMNSPNNFRPHASPPNGFNNNNQPPHGPPPPYSSLGNNYNHHPQGPPPPYTNNGHGYGGYGGHGGYGGSYGPQSPGYFGGYANNGKNFGGVSQTRSALTGVGIAGAGIGTVLTGLALWNLARSTGRHHHTVIYDNRGQPIAVAPENSTTPVSDPFLDNLVNCTLTINNGNTTEVLAIPCSIATSFTPDANVKDLGVNSNNKEDNTKCTITVVTKEGKEFMTTIPCSVLLNSAAENNVTETPISFNSTDIEIFTTVPTEDKISSEQPTALRLSNIAENTSSEHISPNCTQEPGDIRDPINPCFSVNHNLTVIPLQPIEK